MNVAVSATYTLPENFTLPVKDYIYCACSALIAEHPVLSAIPAADETQRPYFVRLPHINLDEVITFQQRQHVSADGVTADGNPVPDLDLQALLQTQHNEPFSAPNPYWRLCILIDWETQKQFTAAYVFHHALGDGTSGKAFHQGFLQALDKAEPGKTETIIKSPKTPLLPNIEAIHTMPLSLSFLAKKLFQAKIYSWQDPGLWTGGKIQTPPNTRVRLAPFSKKLTAALRERCRCEHTTITAVLQTVVARSLFAHLPNNFTRLACTGAISCRRWLPDLITDEVMGVFVQDYEETYSRAEVIPSNSSFPWNEARRSRKTIESVLARKGKNAGPNLLRFVSDYQQELCYSKIGHDRDKSFEVSNIGAISPQDESESMKPVLRGMVFSQGASVIGNAVQISAVTGGDGCLVLAFSWQESVVEGSLVDAVIGSLGDELRRLAGSN